MSHWEMENSDATTADSDDDDLNTIRGYDSLAAALFARNHDKTRTRTEGPSVDNEDGIKREPKSEPAQDSKGAIDLSADDDDTFNDGEAAYKEFKNRNALKRKRGAKPKLQPKSRASAGARQMKAESGAGNSFVGRLPKREDRKNGPAARTRPRMREYGDVSSDDELMEYTLPDYLQKRRGQFETRVEDLRQAGLNLPPEYDDVEFSDDERLEELQERPTFGELQPCGEYKDITLPYSAGLIPAPVAQWLRQYQVDGAAFLHELFVYQKGGILGDDMGLGKTVQVIAFLTAAYGKTGDERDAKRMRKMRRSDAGKWYPRTLIVCPGTLIQNWKAEFARWGWWHVEAYHGADKEMALEAARSGRVEVLITTYTTYMMNKDFVNMVDWDCVVADECHTIKERKSETTKAMNVVNALCRIGLTGTAIQNKYEELWTLLNWTNPGKLGPVTTWKRTISEPLRIGQSHDATLYQLSRARRTAKKLVENLLPQFFLRRMKTLIAHQLPKKSDRVVFCPLTETQADAYENLIQSEVVDRIKTSTERCDCGSGKKAGWCCRQFIPGKGRWQSYVFPSIAILQKLSNHLATLIPQGADAMEKQERDKELLEIAVPDQWETLYRTRDSIVNYANSEFCGKWKVLKKLLKWWHANGDKVLVFSHSVRLLKMLQMLFHHTSYNVSYLDGAMSYDERTQVVHEFNSDPQQFVFLISTRAGGVGLNITSANKVVVVDPNWNPSYDLQAQDRAYRIGQYRDVEVFRLISAGTIEEIVYARQIYKQQQANIGYNASTERRYFKGVQEKKDQKGEIFGLNNLFEYQDNNIVLRDIVNKTNVAESRAGVQVAGVEFDEYAFEEDMNDTKTDDAVMTQLAAMIRDEEETAKGRQAPAAAANAKHDPIQAILTGSGVEYTHLNNEVIGSSKMEERLSKRAELADEKQGERHAFGSQSGLDLSVVKKDGRPIEFRYHPPQDVKRRQFCSMARRFGFPDATAFALVVEGMTQAERRACLEKWYRERREVLLEG